LTWEPQPLANMLVHSWFRHTYIDTRTHTHTHTHTLPLSLSLSLSLSFFLSLSPSHAHADTHAHTRTHAQTHTHTDTHTHTHTHMCTHARTHPHELALDLYAGRRCIFYMFLAEYAPGVRRHGGWPGYWSGQAPGSVLERMYGPPPFSGNPPSKASRQRVQQVKIPAQTRNLSAAGFIEPGTLPQCKP
jgi:hypothetical protein